MTYVLNTQCGCLLFGAVLLLSAGPPPPEKRRCFDDTYCIVVKQKTDTLDFYIENLLPVEITIRFETELRNLAPSTPFPHAATYPGAQQTRAFRLVVDEEPGAWGYRYESTWAYGSLEARHDEDYVYALPYPSRRSYRVTQAFFGSFSHQNLHAVDFAMPEGTPVLAAREGVVVAVRDSCSEAGLEEYHKRLANFVLIRHADGTLGHYAHLSKGSVTVKTGAHVAKGQMIGRSGHTGYSRGPHLHFEVYTLSPSLKKRTVPVRFRVGKRKVAVLEEGRSYRARGG